MESSPTIRELPRVAGRRGWPWTEAGPPCGSPPGAAWPRVTIVTPSFNQGRYLEEAIRSVLLQAYPDVEYIVIDGGSSDGSVEILRRYEPWLSSWSSEPDRGQSDAINRGFGCASGDIVTFLASDDVYEPGTFEDVAGRWLASPNHGAIVGAFRFMDEASRRAPEVHPPRLPGPGPHDLALLPPRSWRLHQVAAFYSRRALDEVGRFVAEDLDYTMDRDLLHRVCRRFPVLLSERPYAAFRRHPESKSTTSVVPMYLEMASLHLRDAPPGEPLFRRLRRRRLARERRARGYVKLARSGVGRAAAALALVRALAHRPELLARRSYWVAWLAVLGWLDGLRRLVRTGRPTT